jgi:hypothetical protein
MRHGLFMAIFISRHSVLAQSGWSELVSEGKRPCVQQRYAEAETKYREAMRTPEFAASAEVRALVGRAGLLRFSARRGACRAAEPALLTGKTSSNQAFAGSRSICIVGCPKKQDRHLVGLGPSAIVFQVIVAGLASIG